MTSSLDFSILDDITLEKFLKNTDLIVKTLINEIKNFLNLDPYYQDIEFNVVKKINDDASDPRDIFSIGVSRKIEFKQIAIFILENYINFLPFILLREILNIFTPSRVRKYELIQIVINQIIMSNLSKSIYLNEWREVIRGNLEQYDNISLGFNRLTAFDRLENFFKIQESSYNPIQFFFHYIRINASILTSKLEKLEYDIHTLFFSEFETYMSQSLKSDEIIETIRCLVIIFYKIKKYPDLLSFKSHFQEYKEKGLLNTQLSLRQFTKNLNWIKNYSYIAPSYQLNWKMINMCLIMVYFELNPKINKSKALNLIEQLPFFNSPRIYRNSFTYDIFGYFIIPKVYLEDLKRFIENLENRGYLNRTFCLQTNSAEYSLNLNYYREYSQNHVIVNPSHQSYDEKYELGFKIDYGKNFYKYKLSLLEFLFIDRIRFFSVTGLSFEKRDESLRTLKSDSLNEIITERAVINNLKKTISSFHKSSELRNGVLILIKTNKKNGFFFIKTLLEEYLSIIEFCERVIEQNPNVKNISQFHELIYTKSNLNLLEKYILLNKDKVRNFVFKNVFSKYFISRTQYEEEVQKIKKFHDLFNLCYNLKLFDLNSIKKVLIDKNLIKKIFKKKEEKLKSSYEKYKLYKVTRQRIDNILDRFLDNKPPLILPNMINTIPSLYSTDFLHILIIDSHENSKNIEIIKKIFPRSIINKVFDIFSNQDLLNIEIHYPFLTNNEKQQLYSAIYNIFKEAIIFAKNFIWSGYYSAFSSKNFYDFHTKQYFYTKDLFSNYFLYMSEILGNPIKRFKEEIYHNQAKLWLKETNYKNLVKSSNSRLLRDRPIFNMNYLFNLIKLHSNLSKELLNFERFKDIYNQLYFKTYVKSIKFIPAFKNFGFSKSFFYLRVSNLDNLNLKLLLTNTFLKIKYPGSISNSYSFFISYLTPFRTPNIKYLNWLAKAKKIIKEYCVFFIKKVYQTCHFNFNINPEGWKYDKDRFKIYIQNILFNPKYNQKIPKIKSFDVADKSVSSYFGPDSAEYRSLIRIHNWRTIDLKSFLGTRKFTIIDDIKLLLKQKLIFPYLTLKNLDLNNKIYLILPKLKSELIKVLIKIFSFFNNGFIFEIEGEYFIFDFSEEMKFENGLMVKLYLPKCELHEFMKIFDLLFEYLEIKDYIILNDLVDGTELLKSVYGGLDFLKEYNPLKNLKWNSKDKQWMNHKLFNQKFEPIYPDLNPKGKE